MAIKTRTFTALVWLGLLCVAAAAPVQSGEIEKANSVQDCPMYPQQVTADSHQAVVEAHGDEGMGFSHRETTHHFRLSRNGGAIEVTANHAADMATTEAIRSHLLHVTLMFRAGDFSTPMFVHDAVPPGVTAMKLLKQRIRYRYEEISSGGRVRIESSNALALAAIHDFLRFQISDHHTSDSQDIH